MGLGFGRSLDELIKKEQRYRGTEGVGKSSRKKIEFFIETRVYFGQGMFHLTTALFCSGFRDWLTHFSTGTSASAQKKGGFIL
jgi:hypothetical protein